MIIILILVIIIFFGVVIQLSERARLKIGDLLNNENDRRLIIERCSGFPIELQRVRTVGRYKGGNSTHRKISIDAPIPISSGWVSISETLQLVKVGKYKDSILFSTGYNVEDKITLQKIIRKINKTGFSEDLK